MSRILIIEDHADLAEGLAANLEIEGHEVEIAGDGRSGLERALAYPPDLVVLDLMLPELDGRRVLERLRKEGVDTPVLVLTARGEETDKVLGFRLGADDYVTKPFGLLELLARVSALLRRGAGVPAARGWTFGDLEVDHGARRVTRAGIPLDLTPKEYDLLVALIGRDGAVASRVELMKEVWGYPAAVVSRTVDTHVAELRRKLEDDPADPRFVLTVRSAGYRFNPEAVADRASGDA